MGSPIVTAIKDLIAEPAVREDAVSTFQKAMRPMVNYFAKTDVGQSLVSHLNEYHRKTSINLTDLVKQEEAKPLSLRTEPSILYSKAARSARKEVFGQNDSLITAHIVAAEKLHGRPYSISLQDHVAMVLKDTTEIDALSHSQQKAKYGFNWNPRKYDPKGEKLGKQPVSLSKFNYLNDPETKKAGRNIAPVYKPQTPTEKWITNAVNVVAAPFIVLPHIATIFNNTFGGDLPALTRALSEVIPGTDSYKKWHDILSTTGIFADTSFRGYSDYINYRAGKIAQITNNPSVGYYLNKIIHQPGFNALRDWQLTFTGATAKLTAEKYAIDYFQSGSKKAEYDLKNIMGLNLNEIKAQKGQLNPEQIEKAIYHYVDKKIFLNNVLRRSYYSGSNPIMRTALMYHGYVAAQGQLIRDEFKRAWALKGSHPGQLAQFFVVAGVVFPIVGEGVKQLERFARGQDSDFQEDLNSIENFKNHPMDAALTFADAYAHMAGFGVAASYTESAARGQLASTIIGPAPNMLANMFVDTVKPINAELHGKHGDFKPLARDVIENSLPLNIGKILVHRYLPTQKELKERGEEPQKKLSKLKTGTLKKLSGY